MIAYKNEPAYDMNTVCSWLWICNNCRLHMCASVCSRTSFVPLYLLWEHIADVVPWMPVEPLLESFLVEKVSDEPDRAPEDKESIEHARVEVHGRLLRGEASRRPQEVHKGGANRSVYIEDEVRLFSRGELLDLHCIVEHLVLWEVLDHILLEDLHSLVGILEALDPMADPHDEPLLVSHLVDEDLWREPRVDSLREHLCGAVDRAAEAWADCEQPRDERRDEIFARACGDDRVVRA